MAEAEYVQHEFIIETETEKKMYVYNFDLMTMDRVLQAAEMFRVLEELRQHPPASLKDTKIAVERQIERNAFAALLMKKITDKEGKTHFERYEPGLVSSFDFLAELTGAENYRRLEECRTDFFMHTGMLLASSMKGLSDISASLNDMKPEVVQSILASITKSETKGE